LLLDGLDCDAVCENPALRVEDHGLPRFYLLFAGKLDSDVFSAEFCQGLWRFKNLVDCDNGRLIGSRDLINHRTAGLFHSAFENKGGLTRLLIVAGIIRHCFLLLCSLSEQTPDVSSVALGSGRSGILECPNIVLTYRFDVRRSPRRTSFSS